MAIRGMIGSLRWMVKRRIGLGSVGVRACEVVGGGSRASATRARRRGWRSGVGWRRRRGWRSGVGWRRRAGSGTASRRRGRRSGPLTRLMGEYPGRQGSAVVAADRGRLPGGGEHSLPASHPTAEPCLPARAGVRGLAPGAGLRPGVRSCVAHPAAHAGAMPAAMRRNSARRSVWTRRAALRSVSTAAAASSRAKSMPGLRYTCAFGSEWNLA